MTTSPTPPTSPHVAARATRPEAPALILTGERTLPGIPDENYWFQRHVVAYNLACAAITDRFAGATVLDAGCGEGYGLRLLANAGAARVIGVDLDPTVVEHIRVTHAVDARIVAHAAELMALPLHDDEVDLTVSFQVIEHLHDIPGYLASLRRVTRPGGEIWIATPNRLTFTPGQDTPTNPFHTLEFTAQELRDQLTRAGLDVVQLLGLHHGALLAAFEQRAGASFTDLLIAGEPAAWDPDLRATVHSVQPSWFDVRAEADVSTATWAADLDRSLDLLARCVVR